MRRRHGVHVVDLAAPGALAVELAPIPGNRALAAVFDQRLVGHVLFSEDGVRLVGARIERFGARRGVGEGIEIDRQRTVGRVVIVKTAGAPQQLRNGNGLGLRLPFRLGGGIGGAAGQVKRAGERKSKNYVVAHFVLSGYCRSQWQFRSAACAGS
jgi:hypothetical protein